MAQSLPSPPGFVHSIFLLVPSWFISLYQCLMCCPRQVRALNQIGTLTGTVKNPSLPKPHMTLHSTVMRTVGCCVWASVCSWSRLWQSVIELFFSPVISTPAGHWQAVRDEAVKTDGHTCFDSRYCYIWSVSISYIFFSSFTWRLNVFLRFEYLFKICTDRHFGPKPLRY